MMNLLAEQKTKFISDKNYKREWILIDAKDQVLGRIAGRIVHRLRGKHRPDFAPHLNIGDNVIVINARHIRISGKKREQKIYYRHSGYPGGMRRSTLQEKMEKEPEFALKMAVKRMLPKGKLGRQLLGQVRFYPDEEHKHQAQQPKLWEIKYK